MFSHQPSAAGIWEHSATVAGAGGSRPLSLSSGLFVMEPSGGDLGEWRPQRRSRGGLHAGAGDPAGLHPLQIQPGHQLHQPGRLQVKYGRERGTESHVRGWGCLPLKYLLVGVILRLLLRASFPASVPEACRSSNNLFSVSQSLESSHPTGTAWNADSQAPSRDFLFF